MPVLVRIPTPLRAITKGSAEIQAKGDTVDSLIGDLERQYPAAAQLARCVSLAGTDGLHLGRLDDLIGALPDDAEAPLRAAGDEPGWVTAVVAELTGLSLVDLRDPTDRHKRRLVARDDVRAELSARATPAECQAWQRVAG